MHGPPYLGRCTMAALWRGEEMQLGSGKVGGVVWALSQPLPQVQGLQSCRQPHALRISRNGARQDRTADACQLKLPAIVPRLVYLDRTKLAAATAPSRFDMRSHYSRHGGAGANVNQGK